MCLFSILDGPLTAGEEEPITAYKIVESIDKYQPGRYLPYHFYVSPVNRGKVSSWELGRWYDAEEYWKELRRVMLSKKSSKFPWSKHLVAERRQKRYPNGFHCYRSDEPVTAYLNWITRSKKDAVGVQVALRRITTRGLQRTFQGLREAYVAREMKIIKEIT